MSTYPPPSEVVPIFNASNFIFDNSALTIASGDLRYLRLSGGTETGLVTFGAGLQTANIFSAGNTFSMPASTGVLALVSQIPTNAQYVDLTTNQSINGIKTFLANNIILDNSGAACTLAYTNAATVTQSIPGSSGFLVNTNGNYSSVKSRGITLSDNQTIITSTHLAGATMNLGNSIYTDSSTPTSGMLTQFADVSLGIRTINCSNTGVTYTNAATLQIKGPTTAGTNLTITNNNAVQIDSGNITLISGRVISSAIGTAALPAFSIGTNTGIYSAAANQLNLSVNGSGRLNLTTASITATLQFRSSSGTVGAPGLSFSTENTSGLYLVAAGNVSMAVTGAQLISYTPTAQSIIVAGSASTPSLYWSTDSGSGFYRPAANQIGCTVSGTNIHTTSSTGLNINGKVTATTAQIGTNGTIIATAFQFGSFTTSTVITAAGNANIGSFSLTGFASVPKVYLTIQTPPGGTSNWDRIIVTVDGQNSTNTSIQVIGTSTAISSTSNTATVNWIAVL